MYLHVHDTIIIYVFECNKTNIRKFKKKKEDVKNLVSENFKLL